MTPEHPHHYRWQCPHVKFCTSANTCDFCVCYVCKTDFSKHGCQSVAHHWAAAPGLDLWPCLPATEHDIIDQTYFDPWQSFSTRVDGHPGPQCTGLADRIVRAYLSTPTDGSIVHLLKPEIETPRTQACLRILRATNPARRLTKAMIGNMHKPVIDAADVCSTLSIVDRQMTVQMYISKQPFLAQIDGISAALRTFKTHAVASIKTGSSAALYPFQEALLQKLIAHETTSMHALLWQPALENNSVYISQFANWLCRTSSNNNRPDDRCARGGLVCMPPCSGKTRVVAALLRALPQRTLIVVADEGMIPHWCAELQLFGVRPEISPSCDAASIVIETTQHLANKPWLGKTGRIIFDDCVRRVPPAIMPGLTAGIVWELTTPRDIDRTRPSVFLRALFNATAATDEQGLMHTICCKYFSMTKQNNTVYAPLMAALTVSEPVPLSLLPVCVPAVHVSKPDPQWLDMYIRTWNFTQTYRQAMFAHGSARFVSSRFLGALAGNAPFCASEEVGPYLVPPDQTACPICQAPFTDPVRTVCNHYFCHKCIQQWNLSDQEQSHACPLCRQEDASHITAFCAVDANITLPPNPTKVADVVALTLARLTHTSNNDVRRVIVVSRYENVRRQLVQQLKVAFATTGTAGVATTSLSQFVEHPVCVLVVSHLFVESKMLQACNVSSLIFAEPCMDNEMHDHISKRLMRLGQPCQLYMIVVITEHTYEAAMHEKPEHTCRELS